MSTRTKNERIRRAFGAYTHVFSYGVDGHAYKPATGMSERVNLTPEIFFEHLYEHRQREETYLLGLLRSAAMCIWLTGWVGVGKSTLAHYALATYNAQYHLPRLIIDFKTDHCLAKTAQDLDVWLRERIEQQVRTHCAKANFNDARLAAVFFEDENHTVLTGAASRTYNQLYQDFLREIDPPEGDNVAEALKKWVDEQVRAGPGSAARDRLFAMGAVLELHERMYALNSLLQVDRRQRAVVLLDNVDSVSDLHVRGWLKAWLRTGAENLRHDAIFLVTVRPENGDYYLGSEAIADTYKQPRPPEEIPNFDEGAAPVFQIDVAPPEITDEMLARANEQQGAVFQDSEDVELVPHPNVARMRERQIQFDQLIYRRRLKFLSNLASGNLIDNVDAEDVEAVAAACDEVLSVHAIRTDSQQLANRNRRDMLAAVGNFVEYVVHTLDLDWDLIGGASGSRGHRMSALKSLYYRWLASDNESSEAAVFSVSDFNPAEWVWRAGWVREGGSSPPVLKPVPGKIPQFMDAMLDYYILAHVYNLSGNTARDRWRNPVEAERIVGLFQNIGLDQEVILGRMTRLIRRKQVRSHGFLETTHFREIQEGERELKTGDRLCVTDRTCCLLEHTGFMFSYIAELLDRHEGVESLQVSRQGSANYTSRIISTVRARNVLLWLRMGLTQEVRVIEYLASKRRDTPVDFLRWYWNTFVIKYRPDEERPSLVFAGPLRTTCYFLEHAVQYADAADAATLHGYVREFRDLSAYVSGRLMNLLSTGRFDLIPRDRPMLYAKQER